MLVERNNKSQITITVSSSVDSFGLQRILDYVKYLEATAKSKAKQSDVDIVAEQANATWWKKNRNRFLK
jgi:hypothetical protein